MKPRRAARLRVDDDASALVVTSRKGSAYTPAMLPNNKHAPSAVDLRKEKGNNSNGTAHLLKEVQLAPL